MDLTELHARIRGARRQFEEPPPPGGSKPILPLAEYLEEESHALLREAVRSLRRDYPSAFIKYPEPTVAWFIVDELAGDEIAPDLAELAERLGERVERDAGPWLISTPLANIELPDAVIELSEGAVLWRAHLGTDWLDSRFSGDDDNSAFEVFRILGDRLPRRTRWKRLPDNERLDTRVGATLLTVESSTVGLAAARARAKARYAVAGWAVLAPPERNRLLPELGTWGPQPWLQVTEPYKRLERDNWIPRERSSIPSVRTWWPYEAPKPDVLRMPFRAMDASQRRPAQALLSSSLSLLQASRGTRFTLSERLRYIHSALDALCEPEIGQGGVPRRWEKVAEHYGVWRYLGERGYRRNEIEQAQERLYGARNVATHGRDAVLLDLGYPPDAVRRM